MKWNWQQQSNEELIFKDRKEENTRKAWLQIFETVSEYQNHVITAELGRIFNK